MGEHRNEADDTPTYYFYKEGSYTPLVKLDCVATESQIYFYHAEQNGMPVMLTDAEGRASWQQQSQSLWGTITANLNLNTDTSVS